MMLILLLYLVSFVVSKECYWNRRCPNLRYSSKTPYDSFRGDIRDYPRTEFCEAVSVWSVARHGNRNPGVNFAPAMKQLIDAVQHQIVEAFEAGRSQLCAQDIENFRKWRFNETIFSSLSHLTETGYKELYDIGKRLRHRYPQLLKGIPEDYYFKSSDKERAMASAAAFVEGLTGTNQSVIIDRPSEEEYLLQPHLNCPRWEEGASLEKQQIKGLHQSAEYLALQKTVQQRLGIAYKLSSADIYTLYDICRFHRTWSPALQDAWCAAFSNEDIDVMEYQDDLCHYYRNGYGSWVAPRLSGGLLKDLRERFEDATRGEGKKIISYFAHNAIILHIFCALGLFSDDVALVGARRDPNRLWKTSFIAPFASNIIVVLNRCTAHGSISHRVQFFINEKPTNLCPLSGCPWEEFKELLKDFDDNRKKLCDLDYPEPLELPGATENDGAVRASWIVFIPIVLLIWPPYVKKPSNIFFYLLSYLCYTNSGHDLGI